MNKFQKAIDQIIRSDVDRMFLSYKSLKKILKGVTKEFDLKHMIEWKDHRKDFFK